MSSHEQGFPWPSLATHPYRPSLPAGPPDYILCPYGAVVKFWLVVQHVQVLNDQPELINNSSCEGLHKRTSVRSSFLLLQQCPTCVVRLILRWVVGGRITCFVGCCLQDVFNIAQSILVQLPSSFFSIHLVSDNVVHPYSSIDTTTAWKKLRFISLDWSDFHTIDNSPCLH